MRTKAASLDRDRSKPSCRQGILRRGESSPVVFSEKGSEEAKTQRRTSEERALLNWQSRRRHGNEKMAPREIQSPTNHSHPCPRHAGQTGRIRVGCVLTTFNILSNHRSPLPECLLPQQQKSTWLEDSRVCSTSLNLPPPYPCSLFTPALGAYPQEQERRDSSASSPTSPR